MKKMKLSDIKINQSFLETTPSSAKIAECKEHYLSTKEQDRYIVVNYDNILIDGYIFYLVAQELGLEEVEIKRSTVRRRRWRRVETNENFVPVYRKRNTTYIYGVHPDAESNKEYVWRVPNSWAGWADDLEVGDKVVVDTKFGNRTIVVTRISEECALRAGTKIRKVYKKV